MKPNNSDSMEIISHTPGAELSKVRDEEKIDQIVADIFKEIHNAKAQHGDLPLVLSDCAIIIGEEYGELCEAILTHTYFQQIEPNGKKRIDNIYKEAIQVAAMAISLAMMLEE